MKNLATAILAVMKEVKGIDKNMTVGTGKNAYQGVQDSDVKRLVGESMQKNGLCLLPIEIEPIVRIDRWEEEGFWQGQSQGIKTKQSVFTEVKTKYLLLHESGESQIISGYGQGVDPQDKGAGKATTYALKNAVLYSFLVPTGKIDDTDTEHSDNKPIPKKASNDVAADNKPWLNEGTKAFHGAIEKLKAGTTTITKIRSVMKVSKKVEEALNKFVKTETKPA